MIYTIQNRCLEVPELPYDDGAKTLFLYTRGKKGNPTEALRELLHYMEDSQNSNVKNDDLKSIHNMVNAVKRNAEVTLGFMKIFEKERMLREEGMEEGIRIVIETCREFQVPEEEIVERLVKRYGLDKKKAIKLCESSK